MGVYAFFVLTGFVLCCLQAHPLLPFAQEGTRPDLVLILVVYFSAISYIDICMGALVVSVLAAPVWGPAAATIHAPSAIASVLDIPQPPGGSSLITEW